MALHETAGEFRTGREGNQVIDIPEAALPHGFSNARSAVTTSRTLMLADLARLMDVLAPIAGVDVVRTAVVEDNILQKPTDATRKRTVQYLIDRYVLDPQVTVYQALQTIWPSDEVAKPLLALICAATRDPLLRASAQVTSTAEVGGQVFREQFSASIDATFPGQYTAKTLKSTGQNLASTWEQSGHLSGRVTKRRTRAVCRPVAVAYALLLGHLCGIRGNALFETFWTSLLDASPFEVREQAAEASQLGWIEYRQAGGVTDVGFDHLLRNRSAGVGGT